MFKINLTDITLSADFSINGDHPSLTSETGAALNEMLHRALLMYLTETVTTKYELINSEYEFDVVAHGKKVEYFLKLKNRSMSFWQIVKSVFSIPSMGLTTFKGPKPDALNNLFANVIGGFFHSGLVVKSKDMDPEEMFDELMQHLAEIKREVA